MAIARNTRELSLLYCIIQTESSCLSFQYTVTYNQSRDYLENNNPDVFYFLIQNWNDRLELFEPIQINDLQSLHDPQRYSYIACIHKHEACMSVIEGCDVLTFTFSMPLYSCQSLFVSMLIPEEMAIQNEMLHLPRLQPVKHFAVAIGLDLPSITTQATLLWSYNNNSSRFEVNNSNKVGHSSQIPANDSCAHTLSLPLTTTIHLPGPKPESQRHLNLVVPTFVTPPPPPPPPPPPIKEIYTDT